MSSLSEDLLGLNLSEDGQKKLLESGFISSDDLMLVAVTDLKELKLLMSDYLKLKKCMSNLERPSPISIKEELVRDHDYQGHNVSKEVDAETVEETNEADVSEGSHTNVLLEEERYVELQEVPAESYLEESSLIKPWVGRGACTVERKNRDEEANKIFLEICLRDEYKHILTSKKRTNYKHKREIFQKLSVDMRLAGYFVDEHNVSQHYRNLIYKYFKLKRNLSPGDPKPINYDLMDQLFKTLPESHHSPNKKFKTIRSVKTAQPQFILLNSGKTYPQTTQLYPQHQNVTENLSKYEEEVSQNKKHRNEPEIIMLKKLLGNSLHILNEVRQQTEENQKYQAEIVTIEREKLTLALQARNRTSAFEDKRLELEKQKILALQKIADRLSKNP